EVWPAARALILNDQPPEAIDLLRRKKQTALAFELLITQFRFREAFELADQLRVSGRVNSGSFEIGKMALEVGIQQARTLLLLGERGRALEIFADLAREARELADAATSGSLLEPECENGLTDDAFSNASAHLPGTKVEV